MVQKALINIDKVVLYSQPEQFQSLIFKLKDTIYVWYGTLTKAYSWDKMTNTFLFYSFSTFAQLFFSGGNRLVHASLKNNS